MLRILRPLNVFASSLVMFSSIMMSGCGDPRSQAGDALLNAFQDSCVSRGPWTERALTQNQALIDAVQSIMTTPACAQLHGVLQNILVQSQGIQTLLRNRPMEQYRALEERMQEIVLALTSVSDPSMLDLLRAELVATQAAMVEARLESTNSENDNYYAITHGLANGMQSILPALDPNTGSLALCLRQNPAASMLIGSRLLELGGSFIGPAMGAAMGVVGGLFNIAVQAAISEPHVDTINRLAQARLPQGLTCGFESMTELYCGAEDTMSLLELQATSYPAGSEGVSPVYLGMDLLAHRLPVLNEWIQHLVNGVQPANSYEASRQIDTRNIINTLQNSYTTIESLFQVTEQRYDANRDNPTEQQNIMKQHMINVANQMMGSTYPYSTPYTQFVSQSTYRLLCYLGRGIVENCPPVVNNPPFDEYVSGPANEPELRLIPGTFNQLRTNWRTIFTRASDQARIYFAQNITLDSRGLLNEATNVDQTRDNIPAGEVLRRLRVFLEQIPADAEDARYTNLVNETKTTIDQVLYLLYSDPNTRPVSTTAEFRALPEACKNLPAEIDGTQFRISCLYEVFQLRTLSFSYFTLRLTSILKTEINRMIRTGVYPQLQSDILRVAAGEIRDRVHASGVDLAALDISGAQRLVQENIRLFRNYFAPVFDDVTRYLVTAGREANEPMVGAAHRSNGQTLAELCTMILATGNDWPNPDALQYCRNSVLYSMYPDPENKLRLAFNELERDLSGRPYTYRMCAFHRFLRASRLVEITRGRREVSPLNLTILRAPGI